MVLVRASLLKERKKNRQPKEESRRKFFFSAVCSDRCFSSCREASVFMSRVTRAHTHAQQRDFSIGDLPLEAVHRICEELTCREVCSTILGLGKRGALFPFVNVVAVLRRSTLGVCVAKRPDLGIDPDLLEYCVTPPYDEDGRLDVLCARAWLDVPGPMVGALLTAPTWLQYSALRGAAFLGLLSLARLHARATEHGAQVSERHVSAAEERGRKESISITRKLVQKTGMDAGMGTHLNAVFTQSFADAESRFTPVFSSLFGDLELRRQLGEPSLTSTKSSLFRFIDRCRRFNCIFPTADEHYSRKRQGYSLFRALRKQDPAARRRF